MKNFGILIAVAILIGACFLFFSYFNVQGLVKNESQKNTEQTENKIATKQLQLDTDKQFEEKKSKTNTTSEKINDKVSAVKVSGEPVIPKANSVGKDSNKGKAPSKKGVDQESVANESVTSSLPQVTKETIIQKPSVKKNEVSKEFRFVNEEGESLFEGASITLFQDVALTFNGMELLLTRHISGRWCFHVKSSQYYLQLGTKEGRHSDSFYVFLESFDDTTPIVLSVCSILEVTILYKGGTNLIPDDTFCEIFYEGGEFFEGAINRALYGGASCEGKLKQGVVTLSVRNAGNITLTKLMTGNYVSRINKSVDLKKGQICKVELDLEEYADQEFLIVDNSLQPLEKYSVYFQNSKEPISKLSECRDEFVKMGNLLITEFTAVSNKEGKGKINLLNGDYQCYVFGKEHYEQMFNLKIDDQRKPIEFRMKAPATKKLVIYFTLNNAPYKLGVDFTYWDEEDEIKLKRPFSSNKNKDKFELNNLKGKKYQIELNSNEFERERISIDCSESEVTEKSIELKPAENYIHGYVKDSEGEGIEGLSLAFSKDQDWYLVKTNSGGYFKFAGMSPKDGYTLKVYSKRNITKKFPEYIYASKEELIITLEDSLYVIGKVIGSDGQLIDTYSVDALIMKPDNLNERMGESFGIVDKGNFKIEMNGWGYYNLTIILPNKARAHKLIPILKMEDNVPLTIQMPPSFPLVGFIYDINGMPVEGVAISQQTSFGKNLKNGFEKLAVSDKDGKFSLVNCAVAETYCLVKPNYAPIFFEIKEENKTNPIKVNFVKTFQVKGRILKSDKSPYVNIKVEFSLWRGGAYQVEAITDENGNFVANNLMPGEWQATYYVDKRKHQDAPKQKFDVIDKAGLTIE